MSKELFRTRCTKGHLVIYDDKVSLELKSFGVVLTESLSRSQVVGVDIQTTHAPLFGTKYSGAATVVINSKGDKSLVAKMVRMKFIKEIQELLNS